MLFLIGLLGFLCVVYGIFSYVSVFINKHIVENNNMQPNEREYGWKKRDLYPNFKFGLPSIIIGVCLFIISNIIVKIGATEVGVLVTPAGVNQKSMLTGWHIVAPWNNVYTLTKTAQVYTFAQSTKEGQKSYEDAIWTPTSEGIKLGYDISVNFQIDENKAAWIYANIPGKDSDEKYKWLEENVIRSSTKMAMSTIVKDYSVIDAYTLKRDSIQTRVNRDLVNLLAEKKIILFEAGIREVHYNPEYEKAINNKKLAEQEALRLVDVTRQKQELLKQAGIDKDIVIQTAQGEAEALKIKGNSITTNPRIIELEWINKWDGALPTYMMGSGQGVMINLKN